MSLNPLNMVFKGAFALVLAVGLSAVGQPWSQTSAGGPGWQSIACSADGSRLFCACFANSYSLISTNFGATWNQMFAVPYSCVACSADGMHVIEASDSGYGIHTSADGGATWQDSDAPYDHQYQSVFTSADGTKMAAGGYYGWQMFYSTNSGVNWIEAAGTRGGYWLSLAGSSDGSRLLVANWNGGLHPIIPGSLQMSTDFGVSWQLATPLHTNYSAVASSSDGVRLAAASWPGGIYTSADSGTTWSLSGAPFGNWISVACSADGRKLVANMAYAGGIYTSTDAGVTWISNNIPSGYMSGVASSADGSRLAVATAGVWTWRAIPSLTIGNSGPNAILSWPNVSAAAGYVLQQATRVDQPDWNDVTASPVVTTEQKSVSFGRSNSFGMFRLISR